MFFLIISGGDVVGVAAGAADVDLYCQCCWWLVLLVLLFW